MIARLNSRALMGGVILAGIVGAAGLFVINSDDDGGRTDIANSRSTEARTPEEFLELVQDALAAQDDVAYITGETMVSGGPEAPRPLWKHEAWYDIEAEVVRSSLRKAPGNTLDLPDETVELRLGEDVYILLPGIDEQTEYRSADELPACFPNEPPFLVVGLVCGFSMRGNAFEGMEVEGLADFDGKQVLSLAVRLEQNGVMRLLVEPSTFLPVAATFTQHSAGSDFVLRTEYGITRLSRDSLAANFFDPKGLGYVSQAEEWLQILDDPALGVPLLWPGRSLSGHHKADLTSVEERRGRPPGSDTPGHVLTLTYQGADGLFNLDFWPSGEWDAFVQRLGDGFLWASCSEEMTLPLDIGQLTILRGHEPQVGMGDLPPPQIATPGVQSTVLPPAAIDPFPNGCPQGEYDRFMAVVRAENVVVTINAPYGYTFNDGSPYGVFDSVEGLRFVASSLRLRQQGE